VTVQAIGNAAGAPAGSFWAQLQPASFRGIGFGVVDGQARFGRRNALHEYPFRDVPWVEDLGRQSRRVHVTGFLVGDDVIAQRERLIAACERPGDGTLVHPTLGKLTVALMEFSTSEKWDQGRVFQITFSFIEQGERQFPGQQVDSSSAIDVAATTAGDAAGSQWSKTVSAQMAQRATVAQPITQSATAWSTAATRSVNSATGLMNIATSLQGNYGRLLGQASGIKFGRNPRNPATLQDLIGNAAAARSSVAAAASSLIGTSVVRASDLDVFVNRSTSLAAAVRAASFTPADALRSLTDLTVLPPGSGAAGVGTVDLLRRLAVGELARASASYQPSTTDEAGAVRAQALQSIDAEITIAGDQGDDQIYAALRALRAEVIRDMNAKGAQLPTLVTITVPNSLPSLTLAQRLYRDATRNDELERRADPPHPAFMPTSFVALSS
jgi:prophage DNA circulation protein